jgi:hypothetical protein
LCATARATPQGTIAPVPSPMIAKPTTVAKNPRSAATTMNPNAAIPSEMTIRRRSLTRRRTRSTLRRSAAWKAQKNAAPRPDTAANFGATLCSSSDDQ